ncbi:MAG: triphosphoribosyl-dephospho-CoA synthase [Candidatus Altiarchaeota archaeon]|nr:triphosphoribosyl-dephospho-CoA synthase [Candidatus Altiarchaeota archaeon]MBU4341276.1 triphosphoribosyl-dephospho-CoA synthase [Candidatus Altiarchaeota archaeon]MBU4437908.1 triphosphoribosyl-dephospho-CoA synthase [Candidatus Altiarchaeota archaeon]
MIKRIANLARLAAVLEVSSRKPGNVGPEHDFPDTTYEDFIAGSIAIGEGIGISAENGFRAGKGEIDIDEIGIGDSILKCISDVKESHGGGNTHLGMVMLFVPIAAGAGLCIGRGKDLKMEVGDSVRDGLRDSVIEVLGNSTREDSERLYDAIELSDVSGLGKLLRKEMPFHELMKNSLKKDTIAEELSEGMPIVFERGVPALDRNRERAGDLRKAVTQTYLELLAEFPDTFIARKLSMEDAEGVSKKAKEMVEKGGIFTEDGIRAVENFDNFLRNSEKKLNPGTTADLVAASLFVWLLFCS